MREEDGSKSQVLRGLIEAWKNRAVMAKQAGNEELVRKALERKRLCENELARLQEFEED